MALQEFGQMLDGEKHITADASERNPSIPSIAAQSEDRFTEVVRRLDLGEPFWKSRESDDSGVRDCCDVVGVHV